MVKVKTALSTKRNRLPRVGDIVHVSVQEGLPNTEPSCLAAIVTVVDDGMTVDLTVFYPGAKPSVLYSVKWGDKNHQWHYPTDDLMIVWPERTNTTIEAKE